MPNIGFLPTEREDWISGQFLTFMVPAPDRCNLNCAFCLIRQRREQSEITIYPQNYGQFIHEAATYAGAQVGALAIQGHEPLLSPSYTQVILDAGRSLNIPTSLVTNGVLLRSSIEFLDASPPAKIGISLDAASPEPHDRVRRRAGAWAATVDGVERALEVLAGKTDIVVISVLIPTLRENLEGMPRLLSKLGVGRWIISPFLRIGEKQCGHPVGKRDGLFEDMLRLQKCADEAGVRMTVDDELGLLQHPAACVQRPELKQLHVRSLPAGVSLFRLQPNGQCSMGGDILRRVSPETPYWSPGKINAGQLLIDLQNASASEFQKRKLKASCLPGIAAPSVDASSSEAA